jgi:hypothetical protein
LSSSLASSSPSAPSSLQRRPVPDSPRGVLPTATVPTGRRRPRWRGGRRQGNLFRNAVDGWRQVDGQEGSNDVGDSGYQNLHRRRRMGW